MQYRAGPISHAIYNCVRYIKAELTFLVDFSAFVALCGTHTFSCLCCRAQSCRAPVFAHTPVKDDKLLLCEGWTEQGKGSFPHFVGTRDVDQKPNNLYEIFVMSLLYLNQSRESQIVALAGNYAANDWREQRQYSRFRNITSTNYPQMFPSKLIYLLCNR